ncbi:MAG: hypothetical protein E7568_05420 [Ruminococcaceae bacterium]|nr:hypothetical protein [Oscillospiraceae bacterium]
MNIIDLHCDTLDKLKNDSTKSKHITDEFLKAGGYAAQCFAIYTPPKIKGYKATLYFKEQLKTFDKMLKESHILETAKDRFDIENNLKTGKISAMISVENSEFLNENIENFSLIGNRGVRFLGFVHNGENCLGYPCCEENFDNMLPLKEFGKTVAEMLNGTSTYADVSHLNYGGFLSLSEIYKKPIVATHSGCYELCRNKRNLTDEQIKIIGNSGGVVGTVFYSLFLNGGNITEIDHIIRHIKHLINVGGEEIVAIGSDFDGIDCVLQIKNASEMQNFSGKLIKEFGYNLSEKICYKNVLRLL